MGRALDAVPLRVQLGWVLWWLRPRRLRRSALRGTAGLGAMSQAEITDEVYNRRAAYQRALSALKARGDAVSDHTFETSVSNLLGDVQVMRGAPLEVTMYAATVTDEGGGFDIRGTWATKELAMARLEMEVASKTHVELRWDHYGDHVVSHMLAGLQYHVDPVVAHA